MDFGEAEKREADMELVRREMARRSRDLIRVFNPSDTPFRFTWDSYPIVIPANSTKDIERYLAQVYLKKYAEKVIGEEIMAKGKALLELREKQLGKQFLDKYEENKEVWDKMPRLNDEQRITAVASIVILGLVEEYGMDEVIEADNKRVEKKESVYEDAFKRMDRKILDDTAPTQPLIKEGVNV